MAWSTPLTAVANAALTAAQWNASVRDNLLETAAAKATTSGGYFASTGVNSIAERIMTTAFTGTGETTASTSYTDLATVGPSVTVTSGGRALLFIHATMSNNTINGQCAASINVTGAYTASPNDNAGIRHTSSTVGAVHNASGVFVYTPTAGSSTWTLQYRVSAGTGTFSDRRVAILPF